MITNNEATPVNDGSVGVSRPQILKDSTMPLRDFQTEVINAIVQCGRFYTYDGGVYFHDAGALHETRSDRQLVSRVEEIADIIKLRSDGGHGQHIRLPTADAHTLLHSSHLSSRLPVIEYRTSIPVLDHNDEFTTPGYNTGSKIFYEGPVINVASRVQHLDEILNSICFKRASDRVNYLGFLLALLRGPRLAGKCPMAVVRGNKPSVGKTTIAKVAAILASRTGQYSLLRYTPKEDEFENRLGAAAKSGTDFILIDNIKAGTKSLIQSAALEATLTSRDFNFRQLRSSNEIRGKNNLHIWATYNQGALGQDLATRSVFIDLHLDQDAVARQPPRVGELAAYAEEHRTELISELMYLWQVWRDAGRSKFPVPCRFEEWAALINGVLIANHRPGFLEDYISDRDGNDPTHSGLAQLAVDHIDEFRPPAFWRRLAQQKGVFSDLIGSSPRSSDTRFGQAQNAGGVQ